MMDPAVKIALALCVLLGGVCAALLFHSDQPAATTPTEDDEAILLRCRAEASARAAQIRHPGRSASALCGVSAAPANTRPVTVVTPSSRREPPPLAADYRAAAGAPASAHRAASSGAMLPSAAPPVRFHKVADGDTLATLAELYLGSAARAPEIFAANGDVLRDPKLLPIGVELKIPPPDNPSAPSR